jgi:hypothetical protein
LVRTGDTIVRHDPRNRQATIMGWFHVADGQLNYRGRIGREPFAAWARTPEGEDAIDALARLMRFRLFGRARAARRQIWRELDSAARSEPLRTAIETEAESFASAMADLCYAEGLPRRQFHLQRLVIVPRALVAGRARPALRRRLWSLPPLLTVDESVRGFFCEQLLTEMDRAIDRARPSLSQPVHAHEEWACVGAERQCIWMDPMWSGPEWLGHIVMYELPRAPLSRRERKELERLILDMQKSLTTMSRTEREGIVRLAVDRLRSAQ